MYHLCLAMIDRWLDVSCVTLLLSRVASSVNKNLACIARQMENFRPRRHRDASAGPQLVAWRLPSTRWSRGDLQATLHHQLVVVVGHVSEAGGGGGGGRTISCGGEGGALMTGMMSVA